MDSLIGYGSDDDNETERVSSHISVGQGPSQPARRRDDDTNYDDVNMDLSEESQGESEFEGQSESSSHRCPDRPERLKRSSYHGQQDNNDRSNSDDSRERDRRDRDRDRDQDRKDRRHESPVRSKTDRDRGDRDRDRRSPRRDDRYRSDRSDRSRGSQESCSRRGLLGDRPDDRSGDSRVPALMDLKPFGGEPPPGLSYGKSQDARDAVSPRFVDRERRERERERGRDKERHNRRSEERRSGHRSRERRSRSRGAAYPPPTHASSSNERRASPSSGDYRPSSYKVNKKLKVMEKMGLQIKTPDGSMATAQQLRAASQDSAPTGLPAYFNASALNSNKMKDQKRKLLWANKSKSEAEEAAKWSGTRFAQDSDGKQVSKFMRLMGIKEPAAVKPEVDATADPNKKQEELFQAMQAQYEVARATTHTMRGVGLGFQRGQF
ncbi:arginine/serine-rich coiled-coil protein 2 isoform X1 [Papilio machaon]|uniref:arginine/serine-rich coiled-coil protein 2 isoform X1 n=2 Tax=Papilio machaon TaxID=76193 RepID=UPI001E663541|nr:arginine/serine-rich coiled-coil protein 2 isoform X1 [Papilio machaon]